jgi:hypothetical protein
MRDVRCEYEIDTRLVAVEAAFLDKIYAKPGEAEADLIVSDIGAYDGA